MRITILLLSLIIYPAGVLFADPSYCLNLRGVTVTLNDGNKLTGRTVWCSRYFEDFNAIYTTKTNPEVGKHIKGNGWNIESCYGDESAFTKWIDLVNFVSKGNTTYPERLNHQPLTLYKRIDQILYPHKRYVGVKEETEEIPYSLIRELEIDNTLQTITLEIHPQVFATKDIERLKKAPQYYFSVSPTEYERTYYLAYADSARALLPNLLGRFMINSTDPSITYNGKKVQIRHFDLGSRSAECTDTFGKYKQTCEQFNSAWGRYQSEMDEKAKPCRNEYSALVKELRKTTDYAAVLNMPQVKDKSAGCKQIDRTIRAEYGFQELSVEELSEKGIVVVQDHYPD